MRCIQSLLCNWPISVICIAIFSWADWNLTRFAYYSVVGNVWMQHRLSISFPWTHKSTKKSAIHAIPHSDALVRHIARHPISQENNFHAGNSGALTHIHTPLNFAGIENNSSAVRSFVRYRVSAGNGSVHPLTIHTGFSVNVWMFGYQIPLRKIYVQRWRVDEKKRRVDGIFAAFATMRNICDKRLKVNFHSF